MAIDYYGSFPCKVRERVPEEELLRMEKALARARHVVEVMRLDPGANAGLPESEWTFTVMERHGAPDSVTKKVRVGDLLREAEPLQELARHCAQCPNNIRADDFGCGGAIPYPISLQAETWLLSRLPDDLTSAAGVLLCNAIKDFGYDGAFIDSLRSQKHLYEAGTAPERVWQTPTGQVGIRSSQILHMTFALGRLQATHAKLVAFFTGFVALSDDWHATDAPDNHPQPADDRCIRELKCFFRVAALAGTGGFTVMIDA